MLETLRSFSSSWIARIFMIVVLLCFALIWGTPIYKSSVDSSVISSGDSYMSSNEFIFDTDKTLLTISNSMGINHKMSLQEAAKFGVLTYLNNKINSNVLLNEQARKLKLNLSNKEIANFLNRDPLFKINNNFNVRVFKYYINRLGIMESDAINYYKNQGKRAQLILPLMNNITMPETFFRALNIYQHQRVNAKYLTISTNNILPVKVRSDAEIKKYYDDNHNDFMTKETRSVDILTLSLDKLVKSQNISNKDISDYYNKNIDKYTIPAKYNYSTLSCKNADIANKIFEKIKNQKTVDFNNIQLSDTNNIIFKKQDLTEKDLDKSISNQVLDLKVGEYSNVLANNGSYIIYKLNSVSPKVIRPISDVKEEISKKLAKSAALEYLNKTSQKINSKLKNKTPLKEVAKELNIAVETHEFDQNGDLDTKAKHNSAIDNVHWQKLVRAAFHSNKGENHIAIPLPDGGYTWYDTTNINPSVLKPFKSVKDKIANDFFNQDEQSALDKRALEIKGELDAKADINQIAKENNLKIQSIDGVSRLDKNNVPDNWTEASVTSITAHKLNEIFIQRSADSKHRMIVKITNITNIKPSQSILPQTKTEITNMLKNDIMLYVKLYANQKAPLIVHTEKIKYILSHMH